MSTNKLAQVLSRVDAIRACSAYAKPDGDMLDLLVLADRIAALDAELAQPRSTPHGHCTHPQCKELFATYLDEHARLMKYEPEGSPMCLNAAPAQLAREALEAARQAIESMKIEAETGAVGDEIMLRDAVEQISKEGLDASLAAQRALADLDAEAQIAEPVAAVMYGIQFNDGSWAGYAYPRKQTAEQIASASHQPNSVIPFYATPQQPAAPKWIATSDRLPDIDVPVLAMINDDPWFYPFCRVDVGDDGWLWADYKIGPLNDPASYEADDDYDVVRWMPLPPALKERENYE